MSFINLHLKMYYFLLPASVENTDRFVSSAQGTFDCSSNVTALMPIISFFYIAYADASFLMISFLSKCIQRNNICKDAKLKIFISPEMKCHVSSLSDIHFGLYFWRQKRKTTQRRHCYVEMVVRTRSVVVSDLRWETKGSQFESGYVQIASNHQANV